MTNAPFAAAVGVENEPGVPQLVVAPITPARRGKKCSSPNCSDRAHFYAATCKLLWTKCNKDCARCGPGYGGSMHVCAHADCKAALAVHMSL